MRSSISALLAFSLILSGCSLLGFDDGTGGGKIDSWCQVDDAGFVEHERQKRELALTEIAEIECPESQPVSDFPDELQLPMPCGRKMVFRAVRLAVNDSLDGQDSIFGNPNASDDFSKSLTGQWFGEVAGGFADGQSDGGLTIFYISKYEVTEPQYAVFAGQAAAVDGYDCAAVDTALSGVSGTSVYPATNMTWIDAVTFGDRYSRWLISEEDGELGTIVPSRGSRPGFLRLPTEEEWEIAARGGDDTGASGSLYEVPDEWAPSDGGLPSLGELGWFNDVGVEPEDGRRTFPVGRKAPNRLMLFDMIGNAEEMTIDLFRPIRPDRTRVGRAGGIAVRGGSSTDNPDGVGVGVRRELTVYGAEGPRSSQSMGFRLVISAPFFVNAADDEGRELQGNTEFRQKVSEAWSRRQTGAGSEGSLERNQALKIIENLQADESRSDAELARLKNQIELASSKAAEAEADSTEEMLLGALMSAGYARERHLKIIQLEEVVRDMDGVELTAEDQAGMDFIRSQLPGNRRERGSTLAYYYSSVLDLAGRPAGQVSSAELVVRERLRRAGLERLLLMLPKLSSHISEARRATPTSERRRTWFEEVIQTQDTN